MELTTILFLAILLGIILLIGFNSFVIVRPTHRILIERLGKFNRFKQGGFHLKIPFIEQPISINITEQMVDAKKQEVITKDNLNATVDAQVYFKVVDTEEGVKKSEYKVDNYYIQIVALARTTLRDIIGNLTLKEANSKRNQLNEKLANELKEQTISWGIEVVRTELKEIEPPTDVQETMNKIVKAENEKEAAVDFATAQETKADGIKRAAIKEAQGDAQAIKLRADAKAKAIEMVSNASEKYFKERAEKQKTLEVLQTTLKNNTKFVIPSNSKVINLLGLDSSKVLPLPTEEEKLDWWQK